MLAAHKWKFTSHFCFILFYIQRGEHCLKFIKKHKGASLAQQLRQLTVQSAASCLLLLRKVNHQHIAALLFDTHLLVTLQLSEQIMKLCIANVSVYGEKQKKINVGGKKGEKAPHADQIWLLMFCMDGKATRMMTRWFMNFSFALNNCVWLNGSMFIYVKQ